MEITELGHKNQKSEITKVKDSNGAIITNDKIIANTFATFFTNVGKDLANNINKCKHTKYDTTEKRISQSMFLEPASEQEVGKIIMELKNGKSPGHDGITAEILKEFLAYLIKPIVSIINNSMETGIFPTNFKGTVITPIYKFGNKSEVTNFRPISLITSLAKVYEKILKNRITIVF